MSPSITGEWAAFILQANGGKYVFGLKWWYTVPTHSTTESCLDLCCFFLKHLPCPGFDVLGFATCWRKHTMVCSVSPTATIYMSKWCLGPSNTPLNSNIPLPKMNKLWYLLICQPQQRIPTRRCSLWFMRWQQQPDAKSCDAFDSCHCSQCPIPWNEKDEL